MVRLPHTWEDRHHGRCCDGLVSLCDILPTLVTAAGGRIPDDVAGLDLIGLARGEVARRAHLEMSVTGRAQAQGWGSFTAEWGCFYTAITDGRHKLIWYPEGGCEQLFDLAEDPQELTDLAGRPESGGVLGSLRQEMVRRHAARGSDLVRDGRLVSRPVLDTSERDLRNIYRLGCMSAVADHDVRH